MPQFPCNKVRITSITTSEGYIAGIASAPKRMAFVSGTEPGFLSLPPEVGSFCSLLCQAGQVFTSTQSTNLAAKRPVKPVIAAHRRTKTQPRRISVSFQAFCGSGGLRKGSQNQPWEGQVLKEVWGGRTSVPGTASHAFFPFILNPHQVAKLCSAQSWATHRGAELGNAQRSRAGQRTEE